MTIHNLKTWQPYFSEVIRNIKRFDVRKDDRNFKVGDILILEEYDQESQKLTGMICKAVVIYKLPGGNFGIEKGYCVLGIRCFDSKVLQTLS
jgi:hypothetical protein